MEVETQAENRVQKVNMEVAQNGLSLENNFNNPLDIGIRSHKEVMPMIKLYSVGRWGFITVGIGVIGAFTLCITIRLVIFIGYGIIGLTI